MKREISIFFTALMYYTRIPCPGWVVYQESYLHQATRYFPFIGWLIGFFAGLLFLAASYLFGTALGIILSMAGSILLTGAFHEDGFADACDGFGGGWTKERILEIMKDSRVGTYGVVGLILILAVKFFSLQQMVSNSMQPLVLLLLFMTAHALSRFVASTFLFTHTYVRLSEDSKVKPVAQGGEKHNFFIGAALAFIPLLTLLYFTGKPLLITVLLPLYLLKLYLGRYFTKWIGGYTGDSLGATQQVCEVLIYLTFIVLWKFT
ncbi:adenosylcobinamide-GDP ribazoletransferase [Pontibacter diazotrophicus]|uniref:Adenosylcobinamide-GDP ribazoletransferase n=1 Tax=Pontibacter diazotrophicus TaxID=1400979 RepID=A0A3D8L1P4_9BACT|nr:adenosylcobinamide-GDP ribazoletransferase [Pontibacter diazotrophicus]RDV11354.1 adenosylcobinamide-GDP ribazoletransferase [Pontibacter diazotrophicus]